MKKTILIFLCLLIAGCQKKIEMPRIIGIDFTNTTCQKLELTYKDVVDTAGWSDLQIEELEKNLEIDLSSLQYDENGWIIPNSYKITLNYFSDIVQTNLTIEPSKPYFLNKDQKITVSLWNSGFDYLSVIEAKSDLDLPLVINYDAIDINYAVVGEYPLHVTVTDSNGYSCSDVFVVSIVE